MLSKCIRLQNIVLKRNIFTSSTLYDEQKREHPISPDSIQSSFKESGLKDCTLLPAHTDILVIGGGIMGVSAAYFLREKSGPKGPSVIVVEKDPTYSKNSTVLSMGGLRQQFSLPENIQMSLCGANFVKNLKTRFGPDSDACYKQNGYLMLAGEDGAHQLLDSHALQIELGAVNIILGKKQLQQRFPWLNTDGIELGCLGLDKEGWFDPWSLLNLVKKGATDLGVRFVKAEVVDFVPNGVDLAVDGQEEDRNVGINEAVMRMPNGEDKTITFSTCVIAGGSESNEIAKLAKIGTGTGMLSVPLPVEKRKRYIYNITCQGDQPGINTPMTMDKSGAYFRRDGLGSTFLCGLSPCPEDEPPTDNLEVDYDYFTEVLWPLLAERVPAFNAVKVQSGWSGFYEYNCYDQNGIIGPHPYYNNFFFATGFSGHGIQQGPAVGRAISELILDGKYQTLDLSRLGFDRLVKDKPMYEAAIF